MSTWTCQGMNIMEKSVKNKVVKRNVKNVINVIQGKHLRKDYNSLPDFPLS